MRAERTTVAIEEGSKALIRKLLLAAVVAVAALVVTVVGRTVVLPKSAEGGPPIAVDSATPGARAIAERLGEAIRFQTISWGPERAADAAAFEGLHAFLAAAYPAAHGAMTRETVGLSLVYRWAGSDPAQKPVAFLAHMDVVPVEAGTESGWTHPPFDGVVADGKVWGRGAVDDKGSIIVLFEAIERLASAGFRPSRDIYVLLGHDEEISGRDGARRMAELMKSRGVRFAWTLDEGSAIIDGVIPGARRPVALIATAEKGYATLRFDASAPGGHSSAPGPQTAVSRAARAVVAVTENPYPLAFDADTVAFLHALAPELPFAQRAALANLWLTGPLVSKQLGKSPTVAAAMRTTTAPTMIGGGTKENILPQTAHAIVNYRIHPRDTVEGVRARAEKLIGDPDVKVSVLNGNEPSPRSARDGAGFQAMAAATAAIYGGVPVAPSLVIAATDSRNYVNVADDLYRFTPFILEADDLGRIHGTDERIDIDDLVRAAAWYEDLIKRVAAER